MSPPVWLITGTSNGFGLYLTLRVLKAGHRVIGTIRNKTKSASAVAKIEAAGGQILELDLTEPRESITKKVQSVGQIDYLVNNAGFLILGAIEQVTEEEAQAQLKTNFFGPLFMIQAALPQMRARRAGSIVNISSVAARDPHPASGMYGASKGALETFSESLAREVAAFDIAVLVVELGLFRTNMTTAFVGPAAPLPAAYDGTPAARTLDAFRSYRDHGGEPGDPVKAVDRIFEAVTGVGLAGKLKGKVFRLILGPDAHARIKKRNDQLANELVLQEEIASTTNF
ncbi:hypothetical protein M426DRAFT_15280 [Hypoxylon sp. CI-4A]|nr:hypothetical protein M426DRAFT_15280 [Hypoxylon sp. CI-4A]